MQQQQQMQMKTFEPVSLGSLKVGDQIAIGTDAGLKVAEVTNVENMFFPGYKNGDNYIDSHFENRVEATSLTPSRQKYTYSEQIILKKDDSK